MPLPSKRAYIVILWLAAGWAIVNCLYVYLALKGERAYRIESAVLILAALMLPFVIVGKRGDRRPLDVPASRQRVLLALAIGLWGAMFLPLVTFPFLSDDYSFLAMYQTVGDAGHAFQFFRPAFALLFVALSGLGHGSPAPFHLASLLLHVASATLVFLLGGRLFGSTAAAIVCFTVFLLNPIQPEAVLWVSGLQELLWTFFVLAALLVYTARRELSLGRLSAAVALAACGLASKETAVCFVLLLPAADLALFGGKRGRLQLVAYAAFVVELAAYLLVRGLFVSIEEGFVAAPSTYFVKQFLVIPYSVFAYPWNRSAVDVPPLVLCLTAVALVLLLLLSVVRNASARFLSGPAVILLTTAPLYTYFFVRQDLAGSRYLYFAAVGWSLLTAEMFVGVIDSPRLFSAATAAVAAALALSLGLNLAPWRAVADLVASMETGLRQGAGASGAVQDWQKRYSATLELKDGIPREYQGVGIFINGYPEFVRLASGR
jgi:hypothetical protein